MALHDRLATILEDVIEQDPQVRHALDQGPEHGRGDSADALQDLLTARNALLDAAERWDRTLEE